MTRPREIVVATTILVLSAVFTFLYAGVVPLLPGVVNIPVPLGAMALAAAALVAAVAVWRTSPVGRWLGVGIGAILLARDIGFVLLGEVFDLISVALDLILLFVLLWRWPSPAMADRPSS